MLVSAATPRGTFQTLTTSGLNRKGFRLRSFCPAPGRMHAPQAITRLPGRWSGGDRAALDELLPLVYDELRRPAGNYLRRERPDHTLQPTALVNEAYMLMVDQRRAGLSACRNSVAKTLGSGRAHAAIESRILLL